MGVLDRTLAIAGTPDPEARGGLSLEQRQLLEGEATATLDRIKAIQTTTRDRNGKLKRAKFKAACLALRWEGFSPTETAQVLGVHLGRVRHALQELRKSASLEAQLDRLDQIAVPLAVDNVIRGVMDGDKEYTRDVLNGRGVYRTHKSIDAQVRQTTLRMDISVTVPPEMAAGLSGSALPSVRPGGVLAAPDLPVIDVPRVKESAHE